jgi:hypothetical protein
MIANVLSRAPESPGASRLAATLALGSFIFFPLLPPGVLSRPGRPWCLGGKGSRSKTASPEWEGPWITTS